MRTVDPYKWRKQKKPLIRGSKTKFGQKPHPSLETRLRESLKDSLDEFWKHSYIAGVKYVNLEIEHETRRKFQLFLLILMTLMGIGVVSYTCYYFYEQPPLVVSRVFDNISVGHFTFPAVALCSNNIISNAALQNYSRHLFSKQKHRRHHSSASTIASNLKHLGALVTSAEIPPDVEEFEKFLNVVDPGYDNITDLLFKLSPPCASMLLRCSWRGELVPCAELFAPRITPLGYCCVFNGRYQEPDASNPPRLLDLIGEEFGLGVVVTEDPEDIAYPRRVSRDLDMIIFEGTEYPALQSGTLQLLLVQLNTSMFVNLHISLQQPMPYLKRYTWLECRASAERSQRECLWKCRRDTAMRLCGCEPPTLQGPASPTQKSQAPPTQEDVPPPTLQTPRPTCRLSAVPCLHKYREKFLYIYPWKNEDDPGLMEETYRALDCLVDCPPSCSHVAYQTRTAITREELSKRCSRDRLTEGISSTNTAVIRLFYSTNEQTRHVMELSTRWYEVFVKMSSQWMVLCGIPALSLSELFYHCTIRWVHHYRRRANIARLRAAPSSFTQRD